MNVQGKESVREVDYISLGVRALLGKLQKDDGSLGSEECIGVRQVKDRGGRVRESDKSWIGIQWSDRRGTEWHSKQREAFEDCLGEENQQE